MNGRHKLTNTLDRIKAITEMLDYDEPVLSEAKQKLIQKQNERLLKNQLINDMVLFRKTCLKIAGGRKKLLSMSDETTWEEFVAMPIYYIVINLDIDYIHGLQVITGDLRNENTKLTWSSYSKYYERRQLQNPRKKTRNGLDEFFQ